MWRLCSADLWEEQPCCFHWPTPDPICGPLLMTLLLCSDGFYGFDVAMVTVLFIQENGHIEHRCNHSPLRPWPIDSGTERQGQVFIVSFMMIYQIITEMWPLGSIASHGLRLNSATEHRIITAIEWPKLTPWSNVWISMQDCSR